MACSGSRVSRVLLVVAIAVVLLRRTTLGKTGRAPAKKQQSKAGSHLVTRLLSLDKCRDRAHAVGNMTSVLRQIGEGMVSVDVDMTVTKTAQTFSKFDMTLIKCRDAVSSNSCEYYQTWSYDLGVCAVMAAKGMPWSHSMSKMQPPFKCPFLKGDYHTRNATAELDALMHIPIQWEGNIWRTKVALFNENKALHLCWVADLEFPRVKNHD
ncbi:Katanin p60 ATPase-containing subunit A1 [Frankliniella fusca]|uniref:Katanin p60 ATPase-containing subunit A1 n=1 Tax=Frankliniella fusca TaxID=407009 RepID=A0AAE1HBS7_9NEOP|nr:Katanin p60 ATPase-containing subunit A1 [Frankliniella fusca]